MKILINFFTVISCTGMQCIKHAFWSFLDYGFNAASILRNVGLNAANFFLFAIFLDFKILARFLFYLLKSQY